MAFKQYFWLKRQDSECLQGIFNDLGYDVRSLGIERIKNIAARIRNEVICEYCGHIQIPITRVVTGIVLNASLCQRRNGLKTKSINSRRYVKLVIRYAFTK